MAFGLLMVRKPRAFGGCRLHEADDALDQSVGDLAETPNPVALDGACCLDHQRQPALRRPEISPLA
jgi:hypothetical protein